MMNLDSIIQFINCINNKISIIEKSENNNTNELDEIKERVHNLEQIINITEDTNIIIERWNELISFLELTIGSNFLQDIINNKVNVEDFESHTGNLDIHVNSLDKNNWNNKYDKPQIGIPLSDLSDAVQHSLEEANSAYLKPNTGIPKNDLSLEVLDSLELWKPANLLLDGYVPKSIKGKFLHSNSTTGNLEWVNDTTYNNATLNLAGLMSAEDKIKLDGMDSAINQLPFRADEEDITIDNNVLKFKDNVYNISNFSGFGKKYLRKNISIINGEEKNILSPSEFSESNTIYIIKYDFDLNNLTIEIPNNCILKFEGGSLNHGTLIGNDTVIDADDYNIFKTVPSRYRGYYKVFYVVKYVEENDGIILGGTWNNEFVKSNWCGLMTVGDNECSRALNNHLILFNESSEATIPTNTYYVYGQILLRRFNDLKGSTFIVVGDYSTITDETIPIPENSTAIQLRSLYGALTTDKPDYTDGYIKNFTIDCNSIARNETYSTFNSVGVVGALNISRLFNFTIEDITIKNCIECGINTTNIGKITFRRIKCENIGEHFIYMYLRDDVLFEDCDFTDWSNDDSIITVRGGSACLRFAGIDILNKETPTEAEKQTIVDFSKIVVSVKNCSFKKTTSRTGSLFYGPTPLNLEFENCDFKTGRAFISTGDVANFINTKTSPSETVWQNITMTGCSGLTSIISPNHILKTNLYMYGCIDMGFTTLVRKAVDTEFNFVDNYLTYTDNNRNVDNTTEFVHCSFKVVPSTSAATGLVHNYNNGSVIFDSCDMDFSIKDYTLRGATLFKITGATVTIKGGTITSDYLRWMALENASITMDSVHTDFKNQIFYKPFTTNNTVNATFKDIDFTTPSKNDSVQLIDKDNIGDVNVLNTTKKEYVSDSKQWIPIIEEEDSGTNYHVLNPNCAEIHNGTPYGTLYGRNGLVYLDYNYSGGEIGTTCRYYPTEKTTQYSGLVIDFANSKVNTLKFKHTGTTTNSIYPSVGIISMDVFEPVDNPMQDTRAAISNASAKSISPRVAYYYSEAVPNPSGRYALLPNEPINDNEWIEVTVPANIKTIGLVMRSITSITVSVDGGSIRGMNHDNGSIDETSYSAGRPTGSDLYIGKLHYDATLGKLICWNGTNWIDAAGNDVTHPLTYALTNITASNPQTPDVNTAYSTVLTADEGYSLPSTITVEMGSSTLVAGTDYTYNSSTGEIEILGTGGVGGVTDAIVITAVGEEIII